MASRPLPIFFLVMYFMFFFAINIGGAFQDFFDMSSDVIFIQGLSHVLIALHSPGWLVALIAAGIGKGINTTITFIPVIASMFLFLAFLQSSGYMARAAFVEVGTQAAALPPEDRVLLFRELEIQPLPATFLLFQPGHRAYF